MKHLNLTPDLYAYMLNISLREHPVLKRLREENAEHQLFKMQTAPEQVQLIQLLLRNMRAKKVLEIGTFMGYATLGMALALPEDGQVITCDQNKNWTDIALPYWQAAGQDQKIELKLGAALDTLEDLLMQKMAQTFDFIYIDADKTNYVAYYERALQLIQPHGLIAIDNVFWGGAVIDPDVQDGQTREIRRLNELIRQDDRVNISLLPITDGLLLVQLNQNRDR